jgi:hypothetical protein
MNIVGVLKDSRFNAFFSFMLGLGIICMIRPMCSGKECDLDKPPAEKDFDSYVYHYGEKCYEFKTNIVTCPASGAIEAFLDRPAQRVSPIPDRARP